MSYIDPAIFDKPPSPPPHCGFWVRNVFIFFPSALLWLFPENDQFYILVPETDATGSAHRSTSQTFRVRRRRPLQAPGIKVTATRFPYVVCKSGSVGTARDRRVVLNSIGRPLDGYEHGYVALITLHPTHVAIDVVRFVYWFSKFHCLSTRTLVLFVKTKKPQRPVA